MTPLETALKMKLAFDRAEIGKQAPAFESTLDDFDNGAKAENSRLKPTLDILVECILFAEEANSQIKAQKVMWPIEVDHLDDALTKLREHLKLEGG